MYKLKCLVKCIKGGILRRVGDTLSVDGKKAAEEMEATGFWEIIEIPVEKPKAKAAASKDPLA